MKEILNTKEPAKAEQNWTSKKELMDICKCGKTTIEQIVNDLRCTTGRAIQNHIKRGGYHNLETYYDDYLVRLIQAKLLSNQANQGRSSQVIKQAVHNSVENNGYKYTKEEICKICNCSIRTFELFAPQSVSERDFISVGLIYMATRLSSLFLLKNIFSVIE